jgi:hypothetical protein
VIDAEIAGYGVGPDRSRGPESGQDRGEALAGLGVDVGELGSRWTSRPSRMPGGAPNAQRSSMLPSMSPRYASPGPSRPLSPAGSRGSAQGQYEPDAVAEAELEM